LLVHPRNEFKIPASFEQARGPEPVEKAVSEEQQQAETKACADLLIKGALRLLGPR
jgi:hypothetical protein